MGTTTLLTFAEFERLPEQPGKDELLEGELFHLPPASHAHIVIARRLFALLVRLIDGEEPDRVYLEAGYKIGERSWVVPDVSIAHCDQTIGQYAEGAPAVAIEVISESNTARQIDRKRKLYLANGAEEVWVLYPDTKSVWVFHTDGAAEFTGELRSRAFPNVRIDLERLFS